MKIHEYQAKALLAPFGIPVPRGEVAFTPDEARAAAGRLGGRVVVKAQIHAGGRGKGGGVRVVAGPDEAAQAAEVMLGSLLVTPQTGPGGRTVGRLLIEEALDIASELYLGLLIDRESERLAVIASAAGGMEIEEVAAATPDRIHRQTVSGSGLQAFQARELAFRLGLTGSVALKAAGVMAAAERAFRDLDASLVEINPLVVTGDGAVLALDAKVTLDDSAHFRHAGHAELRDTAEEDPLEVEASKHGLNYIRLDGTIGCMVNGAGLAMATMDIIKLAGGEPANFLDVGGGANAGQIRQAFRMLLSDPHVKAVLINIFGGILRCDVLAEGVIAAVRDLDVRLPVVVRLEGTNVEEGRAALLGSGFDFTTADTMDDAAARAVDLATG
ncbi:MAG: ADP-forming succinate--CoA ligase subunit beta [Acidobacteria bacterium]|nr:ADP-forming succinate--CoA ligase subunit beta [Acidobacteriota bacterium]